MKRLAQFGLILFAFFLLLNWQGCAGSKKTTKQGEAVTSQEQGGGEDYDEIEKLLGIDREASKKEPAETKEKARNVKQQEKNDDLTKLLGVEEGKKKQPSASGSAVADKRIARLQKQIESLKKELKKKDLEIAELKSQLQAPQKSQGTLHRNESSGADFYPAPSTGFSKVSSDEYKAKYEQALELFKQHRYREALTVFENLLASDTNNDLADNAQYWIGECYYAMGRYREAIMAFEKVFTFKFSNKNDYAQFKIGQCYYQLGDKQRARREFQELLDNYPDSELVPRAREYLSKL